MNHQNTYNKGPAPAHSASGFTIFDIMRGFWARKIPIIIFLALSLIATYLVISRIEPLYKADAKILIEGHDPDSNRFSARTQASPADILQVSSQAQIIQSQDLASQVIEKLKLDKLSEFTSQSGIPFLAKEQKTPKKSQVRKHFFENLTVYPIAETRIIVVEYNSTSARRAAEIANTLAQTYIESTRNEPLKTNASVNSYLSTEINKLKEDINRQEKSLEKFRARNGLIEGNNGTLYAQELAELNRQIAEASSVRAEASAKAASARRLLGGNQNIDIAGDVIKSELIGRLREQQIQLRRQLTEKSTTYLPAHPEIVQLNGQLQNLDRLVAFEITKIAASLTDQAKVASARENTLRAKLNRLKTKAVSQGQSAAKLNALQRDIKAKRDLMNTYLTKQADSISRQNINNIPATARIVSTAVASTEPYFPKTVPILCLSFLSALMLSFVFSFLKDTLSGQLTPSQGAHNFAHPTYKPQLMPVTGFAKQDQQSTASPLAAQPSHLYRAAATQTSQDLKSATRSGQATQFSLALSDKTDMTTLYAGGNDLEKGLINIASHAHHYLQSTQSKILLVTSADTFSPKPYLSAGLARIFAQNGLKTIILDADMMNPSISQLMSVQPAPGLSEILTGAAPFSETVGKDFNTGTSVIPAGARGAQAYAQLGTDSASLVLRSLSMVYDIIIIHGPAMSEHKATQFLAAQSAYICLAGGSGRGEKQNANSVAATLLNTGDAHVAHINCTPTAGGKLSNLFKKKAA